MSQQDVIQLLGKKKQPLSLREICASLNKNLSERAIADALLSLLKSGEVLSIELTREETEAYAKLKGLPIPYRKMRLYIKNIS